MKGIDSWTFRAAARSVTYGEIKEVIATVEASANSLDTYCTIVAVSNGDPCERAVVAAMPVIVVGSSGGECKGERERGRALSCGEQVTYFSYAANILVAVLLGKTEVFV
jgi:hypothetical protein